MNGDAGIIGERPAAFRAGFRVGIRRLQGREGNHRQTVSAGAMKAAHIELPLGGGHGHVQEARGGQEDEGAGHALPARIEHAPRDSRERYQAGFERHRNSGAHRERARSRLLIFREVAGRRVASRVDAVGDVRNAEPPPRIAGRRIDRFAGLFERHPYTGNAGAGDRVGHRTFHRLRRGRTGEQGKQQPAHELHPYLETDSEDQVPWHSSSDNRTGSQTREKNLARILRVHATINAHQ